MIEIRTSCHDIDFVAEINKYCESKKNNVKKKNSRKKLAQSKKESDESEKKSVESKKSSSIYQSTDKLLTKFSEMRITPTPNCEENTLAIVKYFNDDRIVFASQQVLISDYLLTGINEAMEILNLPDDYCIVNVLYGLRQRIKDATGDMQLFVTGTAENGETSLSGIINELKEEIRVSVDPSCLRQLYWCENKRKRIDYTWFGCSVADLKVLPQSVKQRSVSDTRSSIKRKLSCIIYGDISQIKSFLLHKFPWADYNPHEDIDGVGCMKVKDVKNIIRLIQTKYNRSVRSKFYWYRDKPDELVFSGTFCPDNLIGTI